VFHRRKSRTRRAVRCAHPGMYFLEFQPYNADREGSVYPIIVRDPIEEVGPLSIIAQDHNSVVGLFVESL
jgi:hypothetical protein